MTQASLSHLHAPGAGSEPSGGARKAVRGDAGQGREAAEFFAMLQPLPPANPAAVRGAAKPAADGPCGNAAADRQGAFVNAPAVSLKMKDASGGAPELLKTEAIHPSGEAAPGLSMTGPPAGGPQARSAQIDALFVNETALANAPIVVKADFSALRDIPPSPAIALTLGATSAGQQSQHAQWRGQHEAALGQTKAIETGGKVSPAQASNNPDVMMLSAAPHNPPHLEAENAKSDRLVQPLASDAEATSISTLPADASGLTGPADQASLLNGIDGRASPGAGTVTEGESGRFAASMQDTLAETRLLPGAAGPVKELNVALGAGEFGIVHVKLHFSSEALDVIIAVSTQHTLTMLRREHAVLGESLAAVVSQSVVTIHPSLVSEALAAPHAHEAPTRAGQDFSKEGKDYGEPRPTRRGKMPGEITSGANADFAERRNDRVRLV